jgi:hypothetical protein
MKQFLIILLFLFGSTQAWALPAVENVQVAISNGSGNTTLTINPSGINRLLVVILTYAYDGGDRSAVTFGAASLAEATYCDNYPARVSIWYLVNPATGSDTVTVSYTGGVHATVAAITFSGAHQITPLANASCNSGTTDPASVTVTSGTSNDLTLAAVNDAVPHSSPIPAVRSPATEQFRQETTGNTGAGATQPSAGSITTTWDYFSVISWVAGGINVKNASSAPVSSNFVRRRGAQ